MAEIWWRYGGDKVGDVGEIWRRCRGDMGEIRPEVLACDARAHKVAATASRMAGSPEEAG